MDLSDPEWVEAILEATKDCGLVEFDTWTDLRHGDENSNEEVRDFDTDVHKAIQRQGGTPLVIHHTGHKQMFSDSGVAKAGPGIGTGAEGRRGAGVQGGGRRCLSRSCMGRAGWAVSDRPRGPSR